MGESRVVWGEDGWLKIFAFGSRCSFLLENCSSAAGDIECGPPHSCRDYFRRFGFEFGEISHVIRFRLDFRFAG